MLSHHVSPKARIHKEGKLCTQLLSKIKFAKPAWKYTWIVSFFQLKYHYFNKNYLIYSEGEGGTGRKLWTKFRLSSRSSAAVQYKPCPLGFVKAPAPQYAEPDYFTLFFPSCHSVLVLSYRRSRTAHFSFTSSGRVKFLMRTLYLSTQKHLLLHLGDKFYLCQIISFSY